MSAYPVDDFTNRAPVGGNNVPSGILLEDLLGNGTEPLVLSTPP